MKGTTAMQTKFKIRRMMAVGSYIQISLLIPIVLAIVFFGSTIVAANLAAASAILLGLIAALTGIIGHYNHMVYSDDKNFGTKEKNDVGTN